MSRNRRAAPYAPPSFAPSQHDPAFLVEQLHQLSRALELMWPLSGAWTPVLTFDTPGDLSVSYSFQTGNYYKRAGFVFASFAVITSSFTHTTASGQLKITGLPFDCDADAAYRGAMDFGGITKAGYTQIVSVNVPSDNELLFVASGSGVAASSVVVADVPTGGTVRLVGAISYLTA